jgi:Tfp pilus assembly protein PilP
MPAMPAMAPMSAMPRMSAMAPMSAIPAVRAGLGLLLLAAVVLSGCGEDDAPPPPPRVAATPTVAATPGAAGAGSKTMLTEKQRIEDRVQCPIPDRPTDPVGGRCDPKAPSCGEHLYCLAHPTGGHYCEPCPERDSIRHVFKERDFVAEQNRDPFQSFLLPQVAALGGPVDFGPTKACVRDDQIVATSYSYAELKLVGIVAMGTQRKVLMMGGPLGYIIKRGDCVGKEKAVVKDIGTSYITFQIEPDASTTNQRPPQEHSVQLNPTQLLVNAPGDLPTPAPRTTIAPVVPPPASLPSRGAAPPPAAPAAPTSPGAAAPAPATSSAAPAPAAGSPGAGASAGSAAPPVVAPPAAKKP